MRVLKGDGGAICSPRFFFLCVVLSLETCFSIEGNVLSAGQNLRVQDTLISEGSIFELGFFTKGESLNIYFGIWYKNFPTQTIVWVANRDKPLASPSSSALKLGEDGNLILIDGSSKTPIWNTNQSSTSSSTEAVLLDDGNFVLRDSLEPSTIYWQSFNHPTDTFLPGAKIGINELTGTTLRLTSWKNSEDPAPGTFSIELEPYGSPQFFLVWNTSIRYWTSGVWDGKIFSLVPEMRANNIYNYSVVINEGERYFTYTLNDTSMLSRLIIDQSGQIKFLAGFKGTWEWISFWVQPKSLSEVYSFCGAFGLFNQLSSNCECLQGFEAVSTEETQLNDWSKGCGRRTPLQCRTNVSRHNNDGFFKILHVTLPESSIAYPVENNKLCESACMQNCSCNAYAYNGSGCSIWVGDLMNVHIPYEKSNGQDLYLKLAASELQNAQGNGRKLWVIIAIVVPLTVLVLGFFLWKLYRRKVRDYGQEYSGEDFELPFFSFASVFAATEGFSSDNKLGEGGFGPVYLGKLLRGQEIAVKRLSKRSGQGNEEFRNEMVLIAKLQHRNLVKLLGCCVEQGENILIYEYMPNKSLDFFLFDPNKREMLNWHSRIHIIEGIAQGLLYLHQYSRLRIIHRDLKASNILLDKEMNAKISDFGTARMFGGNESQANTKRIVGTYGYMAPEYAMSGLFSIKSDVFSFGVLLLEIVSGKKNSGFYQSNTLNLLVHAWDLWNADKSLDLLDPVISYPSSSLSLRFINIGLLCVQEHSNDRPTMFEVVSMLSSENVPLPTPKTPAFSTRQAATDANSPPSSDGICSSNDQTISAVEAR